MKNHHQGRFAATLRKEKKDHQEKQIRRELRIANNSADRSYGVQAARLAGIPRSVNTAQRILAETQDPVIIRPAR